MEIEATPEIYKPLAEWPELIAVFILDLLRCKSHVEAVALLDGLSHADKALIFSRCPVALQQRLWTMRKEKDAA